jgi:hypothetical protein
MKTRLPGTHAPAMQTSFAMQPRSSAQVVGHSPDVPLQKKPPHETVAADTASEGQSTLEPSHISAMSHVLSAARHSTCVVATASLGQVGDTPSHASGTSQLPRDALQTVAAGFTAQAPAPSQRPVAHASPSLHSFAGSVSMATGAHVPLGLPVSTARHDSHVEPHTESQQTPSTHEPLAHVAPSEQSAPSTPSGAPPAPPVLDVDVEALVVEVVTPLDPLVEVPAPPTPPPPALDDDALSPPHPHTKRLDDATHKLRKRTRFIMAG